jgi:hypothetical protein
MAKGQQRGNREAKKPKKAKPEVARVEPGAIWTTLDKAQSKGRPGKKK